MGLGLIALFWPIIQNFYTTVRGTKSAAHPAQ
jgi:hypothetical protein